MQRLKTLENLGVPLQVKLFVQDFIKEKLELLLEHVLACWLLAVDELLDLLAETVQRPARAPCLNHCHETTLDAPPPLQSFLDAGGAEGALNGSRRALSPRLFCLVPCHVLLVRLLNQRRGLELFGAAYF